MKGTLGSTSPIVALDEEEAFTWADFCKIKKQYEQKHIIQITLAELSTHYECEY
jgi:hypothetical protein